MKRVFYIARTGLVVACMGLLSTKAGATTFTAVTSGNFSSSATWGGTAPSQIVTADVVVIPPNITVTLDQTATIDGLAATLVVNGTLMYSQGSDLIINSGGLSGGGTITVDSMSMGLLSGFGFTGAITADKFTSIGATVASTANITVNSALYLHNGTLNLLAGNIMLGTNATVVVSDGSITQNGGAINLTSAYNVRYMGATNTTSGLELYGSGLGNVDINMGAGASLMLSSDLDLHGMLTLNTGVLDLNGNDLNFMGNSNFNASGSGTITSSLSSNITVSTSGNITGPLRFTTGGNVVNNFALNMGNSSNSVMLGGDLTVNGQLNLQSGRLDVGSHNLMVAIGGTVVNGSSAGYVMTGTGGMLTMHLAASGSNMYYIGTASGYAPATVIANNGSASGDVGVGVNTSVYVNGTSGATLSGNQPLVNNTWYVTNTATTNINLNLEVMWNSSAEVNGFNRNTAYISHYTNGAWDASAVASATTTSNGMFKLTRNNITSLSPFAVMDEKAVVTGVADIAGIGNFTLYPNPAAGIVYFTTDRPLHIAIYSLTGELMKERDITPGDNGMTITELPAGLYTTRISADGYVVTKSLMKQ